MSEEFVNVRQEMFESRHPSMASAQLEHDATQCATAFL